MPASPDGGQPDSGRREQPAIRPFPRFRERYPALGKRGGDGGRLLLAGSPGRRLPGRGQERDQQPDPLLDLGRRGLLGHEQQGLPDPGRDHKQPDGRQEQHRQVRGRRRVLQPRGRLRLQARLPRDRDVVSGFDRHVQGPAGRRRPLPLQPAPARLPGRPAAARGGLRPLVAGEPAADRRDRRRGRRRRVLHRRCAQQEGRHGQDGSRVHGHRQPRPLQHRPPDRHGAAVGPGRARDRSRRSAGRLPRRNRASSRCSTWAPRCASGWR